MNTPDPTFPFAHGDSAAPTVVLITEWALASMNRLARAAYERAGTEWGGSTFGRLMRERGWLVVLIEDATDGICSAASPARVEIEPGSWEHGEAQIAADTERASLRVKLRLGNWHSHPHMAVNPSEYIDLVSWSGYARRADFVGIIINPFGPEQPNLRCWARVNGIYRRLPCFIVADNATSRRMLEEYR